jgi:dihydrofolate synthase / folylpolyglutamate synthase
MTIRFAHVLIQNPFLIGKQALAFGGSIMFNLNNIKSMLEHHGNFHLHLNVIHVGGTNGKGSTSLMIQNILISAGYRVGIYTSPFDMGRFDNININHKEILRDEVLSMNAFYQKDFERFQLTPFEIDTFLALAYFHDQNVDYAVIEVGLGGRDDATNVVMPILSVITNIGLDHQDVLGQGYPSIADKKSGIIKKGIPVVLGHDINQEAYEVIESYATSMQSNIYRVQPYQMISIDPKIIIRYQNHLYHLNTIALYQARNASLAIEVALTLQRIGIKITQENIHEGVGKGVPPKRFQILSKTPMIIIDGAHNTEGIDRLVESMSSLNLKSNIKVIAAILKDKPYLEMIERLLALTKDVTLTTFEHERAMDLSTFSHPDVKLIFDYHQALDSINTHHDGVYLITGSLYFLALVVNELKGMISA